MMVPRSENFSMVMSKILSPCKNAKTFTCKFINSHISCFPYIREELYPCIFEDLDITKIGLDKMKSIGNEYIKSMKIV